MYLGEEQFALSKTASFCTTPTKKSTNYDCTHTTHTHTHIHTKLVSLNQASNYDTTDQD